MPKLANNPRTVDNQTHRSQGGRLVSAKGQHLPLRMVELSTEAAGGIARTELRQVFANPYDEPLNVYYSFPLPASGTVAGFEVHAGERVIRGEIDRRAKAQERYDQALIEGRTAGLLDQERPNLFTQNLGNLPPKADVTVVLTIDQRLAWLSEGQWEWRFPTVVAPRYLGSEGRVPDADRVTQDVADQDTGVRAHLKLVVADEIHGNAPRSPSHTLATEGNTVQLAESGAALDRDVVVRWGAAQPQPGVSLRRARPADDEPHGGSAYGLLTLVPPAVSQLVMPRDLIVLLDVSGSMRGRPLDRAKQVVVKLIESLTDRDRLQIIAFASRPEHWQKATVEVNASVRQDAMRWVNALSAGGATEMVSAIKVSLEPLREDAQRQAVLVTDGLIGFETEAIRAIRDCLPQGSRLHTVGVGSATNDAFLHAAARAGRGTELQTGLDEDLEAGDARLVAATRGPVVVDVQIEGSALQACVPRRPVDLMKASPVCLGLRLRPDGGELMVRGSTVEGTWHQLLTVPPTGHGEGGASVTALYAREAVEDLELDLACGADRTEIDQAIEKIGLEFGVSTRLTSWVAISEEPTVDRRDPVRVERIPQMLPYGMSAEGLGLAAARAGLVPGAAAMDLMSVSLDDSEAFAERALYRKLRIPVTAHTPQVPERKRSHLERFLNRLTQRRAATPAEENELLETAKLLATLMQKHVPSVLGRVLSSPDGTSSIVQFRTQEVVDWAIPREATVLGEGTPVKANVKTDGTTRPGRIVANSIVRIELDIPYAEFGPADAVVLIHDAWSIWIELPHPGQTD